MQGPHPESQVTHLEPRKGTFCSKWSQDGARAPSEHILHPPAGDTHLATSPLQLCDPCRAPQLPRSEAWLPGQTWTDGETGGDRTKPTVREAACAQGAVVTPRPRPGLRVATERSQACQSQRGAACSVGAGLKRGPRKGAGSLLSSPAASGRPHGASVPAGTVGGCWVRGPERGDLRPGRRSPQPQLSICPWRLVTRVGVIRGCCFVLIIFSPKGVCARVTHHSLRASWSRGRRGQKPWSLTGLAEVCWPLNRERGQRVTCPCTARPTPRDRPGPGGRERHPGTQAAAPALTVEAERAAFPLQQGRVGAGHRRAGDLVANGFKFLQVRKGAHGMCQGARLRARWTEGPGASAQSRPTAGPGAHSWPSASPSASPRARTTETSHWGQTGQLVQWDVQGHHQWGPSDMTVGD